MLDDLDRGKEPYDGMAIKERLRADGIDETDADCVMELYRLQNRFTDVLDRLSNECGWGTKPELPEQGWFGSLHYIELVDGTEDTHQKLHAVFSPNVPRIGEFIKPENGPSMKVVHVEYVMSKQGKRDGVPSNLLVPHVYLETDE